MAEKPVYPKMPVSNWWAIRAQFRKTLPTVVTSSYLKSLLNLTSDKAARNLIAPLKQLQIIDEENKPTQRAIDWRDDSKYKETCDAMLEEVYPPEVRELYPGPEFDRESINGWFMGSAHLGEATAAQVTKIYVLLCQGVVRTDLENLPANKPKRPTGKIKPEKSGAKTDTRESPKETSPKNAPSASSKQSQGNPNLHIDLQIHISPDATLEQIDAIFASMAKHFQK